MCEQQLNDGQREAGGLASTRLRSTHDITPLQNDRNRFGLYRCRMGVALVGKCLQHRRCKAEIFKSGKDGLSISGGLWSVEFGHSVDSVERQSIALTSLPILPFRVLRD